MVVKHDDGCRVVEQCLAKDRPAVDGCLVQGPFRDHLLSDDGMMGSKIDEPRFFVVQTVEVVVQQLFRRTVRDDRLLPINGWCGFHDLMNL